MPLKVLSLRTVAFGVGYLFTNPRKFWPRLQLKLRQLPDPDYPALAPEAVNIIDRVLSELDKPAVAEWGCGRSTLWLAKRAAKVVSVEHDLEWQRTISAELGARGADHAFVVLADRFSTDYENGILATDTKKFDVILIDGRKRDACAAVAKTAIKKGGYIVVDNSNRPEYFEFMATLGTPVGTFTGNATTTTIYRA